MHLFGSVANGLSVRHNNDIDVCLELEDVAGEDQVGQGGGVGWWFVWWWGRGVCCGRGMPCGKERACCMPFLSRARGAQRISAQQGRCWGPRTCQPTGALPMQSGHAP